MSRRPPAHTRSDRLWTDTTIFRSGFDARTIAKLLAASGLRRWLHVALDDTQAARLADCLAFFAPEVEVLVFPAWDCLPYDRVSPHRDIVARRLDVLTRLMQPVGAKKSGRPQVVVTTVNALLQRVPAPEALEGRKIGRAHV